MARHPKRPRDMNELAVHIGKIATGEIKDAKKPVPPPQPKRSPKKR